MKRTLPTDGWNVALKIPSLADSVQWTAPRALVRHAENACVTSSVPASRTRTRNPGGKPNAGGVGKSPRTRALPFPAPARSTAPVRWSGCGSVVDVVVVAVVVVGTIARQSARRSSVVIIVPERIGNARAERR